MSRTIAIDYETKYHKKAGFGIKQQGTYTYLRDPRFDPYLISVSDGQETWAGQPKDLNWDALEGATWLSHNKYFDQSVYERMVELGMAPRIQNAGWHCTANLSTYLCMYRDLARACEFLLGIKLSKETRDYADGKGWEDIVKDGKGPEMLEYARGDALRCHNLWTKYSHLWPAREQALSNLTIFQGRRGAQIDVPKLLRYIKTVQEMLILMESALPWIKDGKSPMSTKAPAEECRRVGIPCPPVKDRDGEEAYDEWASTYGPKYQWVKAYSDYRKVDKFLSNLETIKNRLMPDEIFSYDLLYFGAHTGRWAGGGGFNMQNMRKEPLYRDTAGWLITDSAMLREIEKSPNLPGFVSDVLDIRSLFIARPGKKLIISDLSQIEPRVLAWMVQDKTMLASMAAGNSPYQAHAIATMDWPEGQDLKKMNKDLYALAKARVLGLGYGCGWRKFITVAMAMAGLDITKDDPESTPALNDEGEPCIDRDGNPIMISGHGLNSRRVVKEYREQNPLITGLWKKFDTAFRESVGGDFEIELPSGRKLRYGKVMKEWKMVADPDDETKFQRRLAYTALVFDTKRNAIVRKPHHGGVLTENADQAISRDGFGEHLLDLQATSGIDVLWSVHDEAVNEVDQDVNVKDVERIMSRTPEWLEGCPLAAEAQEVPCYKK